MNSKKFALLLIFFLISTSIWSINVQKIEEKKNEDTKELPTASGGSSQLGSLSIYNITHEQIMECNNQSLILANLTLDLLNQTRDNYIDEIDNLQRIAEENLVNALDYATDAEAALTACGVFFVTFVEPVEGALALLGIDVGLFPPTDIGTLSYTAIPAPFTEAFNSSIDPILSLISNDTAPLDSITEQLGKFNNLTEELYTPSDHSSFIEYLMNISLIVQQNNQSLFFANLTLNLLNQTMDIYKDKIANLQSIAEDNLANALAYAANAETTLAECEAFFDLLRPLKEALLPLGIDVDLIPETDIPPLSYEDIPAVIEAFNTSIDQIRSLISNDKAPLDSITEYQEEIYNLIKELITKSDITLEKIMEHDYQSLLLANQTLDLLNQTKDIYIEKIDNLQMIAEDNLANALAYATDAETALTACGDFINNVLVPIIAVLEPLGIDTNFPNTDIGSLSYTAIPAPFIDAFNSSIEQILSLISNDTAPLDSITENLEKFNNLTEELCTPSDYSSLLEYLVNISLIVQNNNQSLFLANMTLDLLNQTKDIYLDKIDNLQTIAESNLANALQYANDAETALTACEALFNSLRPFRDALLPFFDVDLAPHTDIGLISYEDIPAPFTEAFNSSIDQILSLISNDTPPLDSFTEQQEEIFILILEPYNPSDSSSSNNNIVSGESGDDGDDSDDGELTQQTIIIGSAIVIGSITMGSIAISILLKKLKPR